MNELLEKLNNTESKAFELNTKETLDEETAKTLVNKNIHFTWHNKKERTIMTIPGKVLDYKNGYLKVFTTNIAFEDQSVDEKSNKMIENIALDEISNYMVFDNYTKEFYDLAENIEFDDNDQIILKPYKVTNIFNESIECIITTIDAFEMGLVYKYNNDLVEIEYPTYFIKRIAPIK